MAELGRQHPSAAECLAAAITSYGEVCGGCFGILTRFTNEEFMDKVKSGIGGLASLSWQGLRVRYLVCSSDMAKQLADARVSINAHFIMRLVFVLRFKLNNVTSVFNGTPFPS